MNAEAVRRLGSEIILDGLKHIQSYCRPDNELTNKQRKFSRVYQISEEVEFFNNHLEFFIELYELKIQSKQIKSVARELIRCAIVGEHSSLTLEY